MAALTIGGFYIKSYEFTRSWGIEPASSSGVGVVNESAVGAPIAVGDYVVLSVLGISTYGIVSSLERMRSTEQGDEWAFSIVDNRIRLRWAVVFGQWNMEEEPGRVHADPLPLRTSALDEWWGGTVGFDQGVDFVGGIESEMGSPQPLVQAGSSSRGRWYSCIAPGHWAAQFRTYSQVPRTAAQILAEAMRGAKGGGVVGFSFHAAQSKPVFGIDANSGMTLAALIQQLADAQGLQVTLDGSNTLRFERRGSGTLVIPAGAYVPRDGNSISAEPTKVRVVGGSRLVQVNEVPLVPDWKSGWEKFAAEPLWLEEVKTILTNAGPLPEDSAQRAETAARAREMTLQEYILLKGLTVADPATVSEEYADGGRWGRVSRMEMPVWMYINSIVFRSYKIADDAELYGLPLRSLDLHDQLLCAVTTEENEGQTRIVYRADPLEYYPQGSAYVIAKGQPLDLKCAEETEALIRQRTKDLREVWSVVPEFTLDAENRSIRFATPVFLDGDPDLGESILLYPNRGQGGGEDLTEAVSDEESTYLDIVVPNPDYVITAAQVRATFVFKLGIFYKDFGSGPRWSAYHAPAIAEHLLHGAEGVSLSGTEEYAGNAPVPDPPEEGFLEILYDDGSNAAEVAAAQAEGLIVRSGIERSGEYVRVGAAGTNLNGAIDRVTIRITRDEGLVETAEFAKPRPARGFLSGREMADRARNDELYDGQRDLAREIADLRAYSRMERSFTSNEKPRGPSLRTLTDVFRKPVGAADTDARTLADPHSQFPERSGVSGWKAGDIVWLDDKGLPSRTGGVFGGIVVMDSPLTGAVGSESAVKYVSVATAGVVPVSVAPGTASGPVAAEPGDWYAGVAGSYPIGMLAHAEDVPGTGEATLALVRLGGGGGSAVVADCPFGRLIDTDDDPPAKAIQGGLLICGDRNFHVPDHIISVATPGTWLVSVILTGIECATDDDGEIFLPGVITASGTPEWDLKTWSAGPPPTSYDDNSNPASPSAPGGDIVVPVGKLTVAAGVASLVPTGCGNVTVGQCAGILNFARG